MKLYTSYTSPYARIILLTALAEGRDSLQLDYADPWITPPELTAVNPLSQVPALITDEGTVIDGSLPILDFLFDHPIKTAVQHAVTGYAYALLDQTVKAYSLARFQPEHTPEHPHIERARQAVIRGLQHCPQLDDSINHPAHFALGMALSYTELRHPQLFRHLSDANRQAFERFQNRPDVRTVAIAQLEKRPATVAELRRLPL